MSKGKRRKIKLSKKAKIIIVVVLLLIIGVLGFMLLTGKEEPVKKAPKKKKITKEEEQKKILMRKAIQSSCPVCSNWKKEGAFSFVKMSTQGRTLLLEKYNYKGSLPLLRIRTE